MNRLNDLNRVNKLTLEAKARYPGLLLAPAEGFGQGLSCPSGKIDLPRTNRLSRTESVHSRILQDCRTYLTPYIVSP